MWHRCNRTVNQYIWPSFNSPVNQEDATTHPCAASQSCLYNSLHVVDFTVPLWRATLRYIEGIHNNREVIPLCYVIQLQQIMELCFHKIDCTFSKWLYDTPVSVVQGGRGSSEGNIDIWPASLVLIPTLVYNILVNIHGWRNTS